MAGDLALPPARTDVHALIQEALDRRPDLRAADRATEAADAGLRAARTERWPNVTVGVVYTHDEFQVSGNLANSIGTNFSVVRDLGALPPDAILYLLAQPLLDLASDHLMHDCDLTTRYEARFEVEDSDEWMAAMADYNREADAITAALFRARGEAGLAHLYLRDRRTFDRRMERGRQHFFGLPTGAHAAYLRSKRIID